MLRLRAFASAVRCSGAPQPVRLCQTLTAPHHQRRVTRVEAKPRQLSSLEASEVLLSDDYQYVDVRSPAEFSAGHAPGAINIPIMLPGPGGMMLPNPDFPAEVAKQLPDRSARLLIGCKSGARSARALAHLEQEGYQRLAHNAQGWDGWIAAGGMVCK